MKRSTLGGLLGQKKPVHYTLGLVIVVLVGWLVYAHWHKPPVAEPGSNAAFMNEENKDAERALRNKDFPTALEAFIRAGTAAVGDNNWQQAKKIYLSATSKIPDKYVDWSVYDSLYVIADALHDKNLQIKSLQKALAKAQKPNSGASAATIKFYQERLKHLGAK